MYEYINAIDAYAPQTLAPHVNFHIKYGFSYSCEYLYKLHKDGRKFLNFFLVFQWLQIYILFKEL